MINNKKNKCIAPVVTPKIFEPKQGMSFQTYIRLKREGKIVTCPKCSNPAEKIPLKTLSQEIRDLLTDNHVFHCFAYCCDYCAVSDVEILTYF